MYINLHVHSEFSMLDGHGLCRELAQTAAALGHTHLALTDHGSLAGAPVFTQACRGAGLTPILGLEAYVAPSGLQVRKSHAREQFHLTLLAINAEGYHNLIRMATIASTEGFYYKPRLDWDVLQRYNAGIVCLSGCLASELSRAILNNDTALQDRIVEFYSATFKDRYFLEFQNHGALIPEQRLVNQGLFRLGLRFGLPGVATNDCHFCREEEYDSQKLLTAINSGQKRDAGTILSSPYNYLRPNNQMERAFGDSALLWNTREIASWVESYSLGTPFPKLPVAPQEIPGDNPDQLLARLAEEGLRARLDPPATYISRLRHELEVIQQMGARLGAPFGRYMLNVAAITDFCRNRGIRFGPRGSAAGSIVCWALGISEPDPIKEGLLFERFLNSERIELPDIDIDIADERRDEVMQFIQETYGDERVAKVGTYSVIGAKMALRDAAKAISHDLSVPYLEISTRLANLIPHDTRPGGMPLDEALAADPSPLALESGSNPDALRVIEAAKQIAGRLRNESTNAAGVVICDRALTELVPLTRVKDPGKASIKVQTAYEKEHLEELGILKMDILGLSTLSVIDDTLTSIKAATGEELDPWRFPIDDPLTWETIWAGHTMALFQLGSAGMTRLIREFKPSDIGELALVIAFFRPGPMQSLQEIVRRKTGVSPADPPHPRLQTILAPTYGIPVYQEQVMAIMQEVAGFSLAKADLVRKAMGKKKRDLMATFETEYRLGGQQRGFSPDELTMIWEFIKPFADYGFNKAHAVSYAYLAYQSAYLKTRYPQHFYAAALTVEARGGSKDHETPQMRVGTLVLEARRRGVRVLPPHVNYSQPDFTPQGTDSVRYGLAAIKGVGRPDATAISRRAPYESLTDLMINAAPKRPALENLIRVGALPWGSRAALLDVVPQAMELTRAKKATSLQPTLFSLTDLVTTKSLIIPPLPELPRAELLAEEQERLGMFTSPLPLLDIGANATIGQLGDLIGEQTTTYGVISTTREITTKAGDRMAFVSLTDGTATIEVVVFPRLFAERKDDLKEGRLLVVIGRIEARLDTISLLADRCFVPELDSSQLEAITPLVQELTEVKLCLSPAIVTPEEAVNRLRQALEIIAAQPGDIVAEIGYGRATERHQINEKVAHRLLQLGALPTYTRISSVV